MSDHDASGLGMSKDELYLECCKPCFFCSSEIAKLENTQTKLSRHVGQLQAECQALREKEESLKGKLEGKQEECEQFQIHLANLEGKLVSANALKAEVSDCHVQVLRVQINGYLVYCVA